MDRFTVEDTFTTNFRNVNRKYKYKKTMSVQNRAKTSPSYCLPKTRTTSAIEAIYVYKILFQNSEQNNRIRSRFGHAE